MANDWCWFSWLGKTTSFLRPLRIHWQHMTDFVMTFRLSINAWMDGYSYVESTPSTLHSHSAFIVNVSMARCHEQCNWDSVPPDDANLHLVPAWCCYSWEDHKPEDAVVVNTECYSQQKRGVAPTRVEWSLWICQVKPQHGQVDVWCCYFHQKGCSTPPPTS